MKRDPVTRTRLALREIHGHLTLTSDTITAWYVLTPQRWSFTTEAQREALITSYAHRLSSLTGRRVRLRVTSRPYPADEWARTLHANTQAPLPGWSKHLTEAQKAVYASTLADKVVFVGIDVARRTPYARFMSKVAGRGGSRWQIEADTTGLDRVTEIVAGPGMGGRPARTSEIEWLIHRSVRLGLRAPTRLSADPDGAWDADDARAFTDGVSYDPGDDKFAPCVKITADYDGKAVTGYTAVLAVGRMNPLTVPQTTRAPWMQRTDQFPFPVEWSAVFDVLNGEQTRKATGRKRLGIRDMQKQYRDHGIEEPLDLERKAHLARKIEHDTTEGSPIVAARCYGWWRLAVSGATKEECLTRVQEVIDAYVEHQIDIRHPHTIMDAATQAGLLREFIPGEPISTSAYKRRLPALYAAAGLPHVSAAVGDNRGPLMGNTAGLVRRMVALDPHEAMEVAESSGLMPIVGGLGAGKSALLGKLVYESTMRGIITTVLDPSGPLANLTRIAAVAPRSRHLDLINGDDGILNSYAVIADPLRENYASDEAFAEAAQVARQARKMLTLDVARMLLPAQVDAMPLTPLVLMDAVRAVGGSRDASLWDVVAALDAHDEPHAKALGNSLRDMADMPQSRLFFPNNVRDLAVSTDTLLVLTMHGIELPDTATPRERWSTPEQIAVPLLHLATHYTTTRAYGMDRNERKMVALDEAGMVGAWGSGKGLFTRLGRDSRKWNLAVPVSSQNPADTLALNIANWISTAFVGRIEDEDTAREALRLLRIKPDSGYEEVLASLSPQAAFGKRGVREFVMRDVRGNVEKIRVDMGYQPELLRALNTTPERYTPGDRRYDVAPFDADRLATA